MSSVTLPNGMVAGLETPLLLILVPVVAVALYFLVFRRTDGAATTRSRRLFFLSRLLVVTLVVVAAAGPYTVVTAETRGDPNVTLLVDRSASMNVSQNVVSRLEEGIQQAGVPVTTATVAQGNESRIGDGVAANLQENGSVVVVSDGQVTAGRSLGEAAEMAVGLNATISSVPASPARTERHVSIAGPAKASVGVESRFLVSVDGVRTDAAGPVTVSVSVDGEEALSQTLQEGAGSVELVHEFDETGSHRVTASVEGGDFYRANDVYRKTVRVVERPKILYVSRGSYPFRDYLGELYDVETAESVPADLSPYYAVVVQDVAAPDLGNVDALQEFVIDGNGLFVVGGDNAYENGGYENAPIASMLPVTFGESSVGSTTIVFAIDVSGSAGEGMQVQKSIALNALSQLGDTNTVGVVGFNYRAYSVADPRPLARNRSAIEDRIRRLQAGGATSIATGLRGADEMLGSREGTIILISDGRDDSPESAVVANQLGREGTRVIAVGAGPNPKEETLRRIASQSGGNYFRADQTNRLRLLFGGASRRFAGDGLTVVDTSSFITSGVTLESNPGRANDVSVRSGADYLVATADGGPALTSWRYGLGRVVSLTAYGADGTLDGLLREPDSLLLTKSVNYAIGDPERKETGVTSISDTRVGESTTITYRGSTRPSAPGVQFSAVGEDVYQAQVTPTTPGYRTVLGADYAANYPAEYGAFGPAPGLASAVRATGGRQFAPTESAAIAEFARQQSTRVRDVRQSWDWLFYLAALLAFLAEVVVRRLQVYQGRTRHESGLP
ncbi:VWA domain-containing protein [Salinirarus marinus]|uniref:VWA domain-containing protein n=1 Tax=Salinirarus marinus TaxID=3068310 RepID=UPI003C6C353C